MISLLFPILRVLYKPRSMKHLYWLSRLVLYFSIKANSVRIEQQKYTNDKGHALTDDQTGSKTVAQLLIQIEKDTNSLY